MLRELIQLFEKQYGKDPENWLEPVLAKYQLKEGLYVKISHQEFDEYRDCIAVSKSYYKNTYPSDILHSWFVERDFLSSLVDMNKAIRHTPPKKIHSNNILTFFVKKDELENAFVAYESYYQSLQNFELSKKDEKLFSVDQIYWLKSDERKAFVEKCYKTIKTAFETILLNDLILKYKVDNYIKLFLDLDISDYFKESELYICWKIFNDNKYCKYINDEIFGIHSSNFGLNVKKPYLKTLSNNDETPFYMDISLTRKIRLFFTWLYYQQNDTGEKSLLQFAYDYDFILSSSDNANYFLSKTKGKYALIEDCDNVPIKSNANFKFLYHNCLDLKNDASSTHSLRDLDNLVNTLFFNNMLKYYEEPFKKLSPVLRNIIYLTRANLENIFRKNTSDDLVLVDLYKTLSKHYRSLLIDRLREDSFYWEKNVKLLNLLFSIQGEEKVNEIREVKNIFKKMIIEINEGSRTELDCDSDTLYFFVAGQCVHFLLSKSKQNNKTHDLLLPFIQTNSAKQLKLLLRTYFKKYSHELFFNIIRVNLTFEMLLSYEPNSLSMKGFEDVFMAGYFADNLLFVRKDSENLMEKV